MTARAMRPTASPTIDPTQLDDVTMAALLARGRAERSVAARSLFARLGQAFHARRSGSVYRRLHLTTH